MKPFKLIVVILILLLSACNSIEQPDPDPIDCDQGYSLVDGECVADEVDCTVTPEHEDCIEEVDCELTPEHEDCIQDVDCEITPDHEDCVQEVDCEVTPDHPDCVVEPEECEANQIEVDDECITLSGPQMILYNAFNAFATKDNYEIHISITSDATVPYEAILSIDGASSSYVDAQETVYFIQEDDTCTATTIKWNQTVSEDYPCDQPSTRFFQDFTYDMFDLSSGVYHLQSTHYAMVDDSIAADVTITDVTIQVQTLGIDRIVITFDMNDVTYQMVYDFQNYDNVTVIWEGGGNQ